MPRVSVMKLNTLGVDFYFAYCVDCGWKCHPKSHRDPELAEACGWRHLDQVHGVSNLSTPPQQVRNTQKEDHP